MPSPPGAPISNAPLPIQSLPVPSHDCLDNRDPLSVGLFASACFTQVSWIAQCH